MRKKSHLSLAVYLIDNMDSSLLINHRKAFLLGSILPDCRPSFVTTKHNMEETFDMVSDFISQLTVDSHDYKRISTAYVRKLGEVTHYVADYFTYPHNEVFDGNIKDHCIYEKNLKEALKSYIDSEQIYINKQAFCIGKADQGVDFKIMDNKSVSRRHAYITNINGIYYLRDNNSTNHTYLNGDMVYSNVEIVIPDNSSIRLSNEEFLFKMN